MERIASGEGGLRGYAVTSTKLGHTRRPGMHAASTSVGGSWRTLRRQVCACACMHIDKAAECVCRNAFVRLFCFLFLLSHGPQRFAFKLAPIASRARWGLLRSECYNPHGVPRSPPMNRRHHAWPRSRDDGPPSSTDCEFAADGHARVYVNLTPLLGSAPQARDDVRPGLQLAQDLLHYVHCTNCLKAR